MDIWLWRRSVARNSHCRGRTGSKQLSGEVITVHHYVGRDADPGLCLDNRLCTILLQRHEQANCAADLLVIFLKMPHVCCSVLEDGGVGWWRFCFETSAEQVSEPG